MFEAIVHVGKTPILGNTLVSYIPFEDESVDISVTFKPFSGQLYGPHIVVFGYAEYEGELVEFRSRIGLTPEGTTLNMGFTRTHRVLV